MVDRILPAWIIGRHLAEMASTLIFGPDMFRINELHAP